VSAALRIVLVLSLLVPAGCSRGPQNWRQWIDQATAEFKAERPAKAFEACDNAWMAAVKEKDAKQVIAAYECLAQASVLLGKPEKAFPAFRKVLADYDRALLESGAGLRHRNNFGAALVNLGEKAEGVAQLEAALDAYEGSAYHSTFHYRVRMLIAANLARAARVFAEEQAAIRVSSVILDEIQATLENERHGKNIAGTLGTGDALAAISDLVRFRGDPKAAAELAEQAKEQQAIESAFLSGAPRTPPCDQVITRSLVLRACYAVLK
jgi:tetratricopeptide (TPR) repeat protein